MEEEVEFTAKPVAGPAAIGKNTDAAAADETEDATAISLLKAILRELRAINANTAA